MELKIIMRLFECYKYYEGSGNPHSDLWIFGFEPGGNPFGDKGSEYSLLTNALQSNEAVFIKYLNSDLKDEIEGNTYRYVSMILEYFGRENCIDKANNRLLFSKSSDAFYSNLFPLSYPTELHEDNEILFKKYRQYFSDLSELSRVGNYTKEIIKIRFENIFKQNLYSKKKIVVLKLNYIDYYAQLLGIELNTSNKMFAEKVKWGRGYSEWPLFKSDGHSIGFLPNGRIGKARLDNFLSKLDKL